MISVSNLWKGFGPRDLFSGAHLTVGARDRAALVGPNGSGKTTLLEMIAGRAEPDRGQISVVKGAVVGYLEQETDRLRGRSLLEQVMAVDSEARSAGHRLAVLAEEIAATAPGPARDRLVAEYGRLQDRFAALGGYSLEAEAKKIVAGLGFRDEDLDRPTDTFSGGWLMRVALARLLLSAPDVLMLDEPTNHLDVESVEWLEGFLSSYDGALLLISHDRDFINRVATTVVEIDAGKLVAYPGDYEAFVEQRAERIATAEATAKNVARKVAATEAFIERFRYKASKAKQVQSRIKALERNDHGAGAPTTRRRTLKLRFPDPPRTGRVVVQLAGVAFSYGDRPVYRDLDFVLERGQKVALVGPNGAGKTTLLKLVAGALRPDGGTRTLGHNVHVAYFAQHQIEALEPGRTMAEEVAAALPRRSQVRVRDLLGRFLFSGDDADKKIAVLSGGERTRVALAKLLVSGANVLCLDEPTNHLDIPSRDALEDALAEYGGALVLITHDRHLIRAVADHIVEIDAGRIEMFPGDYEDYLARRERQPERDAAAELQRPQTTPKERRRRAAEERARTSVLRRRVAAAERELEELQAEMARMEALLGDPASYGGGEDVAALTRSYEEAKRRSAALESEWEEAAGALEAMSAEA